MATVSGDVTGAVALVAAVLLLAALPSKVTEPIALVALAAAAPDTETAPESSAKSSASTASAVTIVHAFGLRTLPSEVSDPVAAVAHGASTSGALPIGALAGKVTRPEANIKLVKHIMLH